MNWSRRLHEPFVYAALALALSAGFGYAALIVAARAFGTPLGSWYSASVQAHGHAQLFGWLGLFVLGMGLYFLPRLRGTQLRATARLPFAWGSLVAGISLRSVTQPLAAFMGTLEILRALFLLSALLEIGGMLLIGSMLLQTELAEKPLTRDSPAYPVEPFAQLGFASLVLAFLFNLLGVWNAFTESNLILAPRYDQLIITLILYGVALPMTFVFSIRNLPLYLRLAFPRRGIWRTLTLLYLLALLMRVSPYLIAIADDALLPTGRALTANYLNVLLTDAFARLGVIILNVSVVFFVMQLDLLHRRPEAPPRRGQFESRFAQTGEPRPHDPLRKPSRANYPDNGEYGRFELLIYSAFAWLIFAATLDLLRALPVFDEALSIPQDAARHAFLVGFIALLIFGMAVRMLPGFSGKRRLAHPRVVTRLFALGNLAALLRIVPLFFFDAPWASPLWALSGIVGWCAVLLLAVELWKTFRQK